MEEEKKYYQITLIGENCESRRSLMRKFIGSNVGKIFLILNLLIFVVIKNTLKSSSRW